MVLPLELLVADRANVGAPFEVLPQVHLKVLPLFEQLPAVRAAHARIRVLINR